MDATNDRLDDMGDDEQEDEIREYKRYVEDPPENLIIRNHGGDDHGSLGIDKELSQEWTRRGQAAEDAEDDDRPAEVAAMRIKEETDE